MPSELNPAAVRMSLERLDAGPQRCAGDFYGYLFAADAGLRDMFPPAMSEQNERLFAALVHIVGLLDRPGALARYLTQLGADHRKYGVAPEHYGPVGDALLRSLRRHIPDWDEADEYAWTAAYSAASRMMIAGAEAQHGPPWWEGQVVHHERRSGDLAVLTVRTSEPLPYQPGQYVTVQTGHWPRMWRRFSVASAPYGDGTMFDLHVRAVPGGWVSPVLVKGDSGAQLQVGPAMGDMTPEAADGKDLLCVAGGTGLAPLKALVEAVLEGDEEAVSCGRGSRRDIHLFHGARTPMDLYDMPALRRMQDSYPWLQVESVVSREPRFDGFRGHVCDVLPGYQDWTAREAFIAGPAAMVRSTASVLAGTGVPDYQLHFDAVELGEPGE
jgi:NAD(P)H-flavin reductase/hemoglobin-like flavoprotein